MLVPAHNEEASIADTIRSMQGQTYPIERVVVAADNCTDRTVEIARASGAEVFETVGNTAKKAGAINAGFSMLLPTLGSDDVIMTMDADSVLLPDCVEVAIKLLDTDPTLGGVSGSVLSRPQTNWLETLQAIEYERGRRQMSRQWGRINVLSGASAFFVVKALRAVAEARGTILPGDRGDYMVPGNLAEDYELTVAIRVLGYTVRSTKHAMVSTDLMPDLLSFEGQRARWYRGTIESAWTYGWRPEVRRIWIQLFYAFLTSLLFPLVLVGLVFAYLAFGSLPSLIFFALLPLLVVENVIVANRVGTRQAKIFAWTYFPLWFYDLVQASFYWRALYYAVMRKPSKWDNDQRIYV